MKAAVVLGVLTAVAGASMALASQKPGKRVVVDGHQIRYNGLGPERWARRYRIEHNRFLAEQRHRRRLEREFRRRLHTLSLRRLQARQPSPIPPDNGWRAKQIQAAETIAAESAGDPWPNCPDPYDGSGSSWDDTVNCENGGSWLDSPGFYRCGLQFDPMWERRFGQLCP